MSGRKQHIIPKHIQENFAINEKIYVYKKDKDYPSNITDNYAERDYYSTQEDTKLDDIMTTLESTLTSKTWKRLLNTQANIEYTIDNEILVVIFHLMLRNKYFINDIIEELFNMIRKNIKYDTKELVKFKKKYFKKHNINRNISKKLENFFNILASEINPKIEKLINQLENDKFAFRKKFHELSVNILITNSNFEKYKNYKYYILEYENDIILSDSILLFKKDNEYSNLMLDSELCILPISKNKILFIYENKKNFEIIPQEKINEELIKNSSESFIFSSKNNRLIELKKMIGYSSKFINDYRIEKIDLYKDLENELNNLFYKKNSK